MRARLVPIAVALAMIAAACSGDTSTETTPTTAATQASTTTTPSPTTTAVTAAHLTITGADGVESVISDANRIVSLSGDFTEILFELGVGDRVVAVDVTTTFPPEADGIPTIGFAQDLAPEPVLAMAPDVVLANELTGPPETIQQLRDAGVPVVVIESGATLDAVAPKIAAIASIAGVEDAGVELAAAVQSEIDTAVELASQATEQPRVAYVYTRGPQVVLLFGVGIATNAMIEGAGATDVGAESGIFGAQPLTPEALVAAAPDVIVLPAAGLAALGGEEAFLQVPGVAETPAGANGSFLSYDEAYFFNLGPRVGAALREFILDLYPDLTPGA